MSMMELRDSARETPTISPEVYSSAMARYSSQVLGGVSIKSER